jgi:glutaredoxin 3
MAAVSTEQAIESAPMAQNTCSSSSKEQIDTIIKSNVIAVFGESWCPFCIEAGRVAQSLGVDKCEITDMDKLPDNAQMRAELKAMTNQSSIPYVFINEASHRCAGPVAHCVAYARSQ